MKILFTGWTLLRILRVTLGILALVAGIQKGDALIGGIGSVVLLQGLLNMSCDGSCTIPSRPIIQRETSNEIKKES